MKMKITREQVWVTPATSPGSQLRFKYGPHVVVLRVESRVRIKARKAFLLTMFRAFKGVLQDLEECEIRHTDSRSWINWIRKSEQVANFKQLPPLGEGTDSLGYRLKMERLQAGLTLEELSRRSGISPKHLSKIEHGHHRPRQATLWRLKSALKVAPQ